MLKSRLLGAVGIVAVVGGVLVAQTPASPAFETSSIKLSPIFEGHTTASFVTGTTGFQSGGRFTASNASLRALLNAAYPLSLQVQGVPLWPDRFDIIASSQGDPPPAEMELMLRTLLAQRFSLTVHRETPQLPTYKLAMARKDRKLGPQLRPSTGACVNTPPAVSLGPSGLPRCADRFGSSPPQGYRVTIAAATMDRLAVDLAHLLGTVVDNQTGLAGTFDVDVEFAREPPKLDLALRDVLPRQLGLKLESTKGPVDVLVIDHVEQPTPD
jgi:uncharacterized protein (TIGR03435 family)